jgi:phosphoribosylamine--glycine ligase
VLICQTIKEAHEAIDEIMRGRVFGDAGDQVVVEEFIEGEELSFLAFTDGTTVLPLDSSQDHKRIFDGDQGPNTGGMGAYSPAPILTPALADRVVQEVMLPVVAGLKQQKIIYKGLLYAGLMVQGDQVKVLEFNVRFGDPECQPLMMRLQTDLVEVMEAVIDERLSEVPLSWDPRPAVCVVLTASGYPGSYETGKLIIGLDVLGDWKDGRVFHAGTARADGGYTTKGGRVLGVTAIGTDIKAAIIEAYTAVAQIHWPGMQYRRDIGQRALVHIPGREYS